MIVEQPSLFTNADWSNESASREHLSLSKSVLKDWKQKIFNYQTTLTPQQQVSLFESIATDPHAIDPFKLPQQNTQFWRQKAEDEGVAALYFVIDYELPIILYIGETIKSNQRWKGEHDCKRYLLNYRQAHYDYQLPSSLGIAFWSNAPVKTRDRQKLELALIQRWRSPFNKENWTIWGTPFTYGKQ